MPARAHTRVASLKNEESDGSLVQQALTGNERAFERLVERYRIPLTRLVYRIVHDYHLTQDILQTVYLQLYLSLGILRQSSSIRAWLYEVARNRSLDELRRKHTLYFSQLSYVEISRVLNIPEATAKTYFQRAKPLLRNALIDARVRLQPA
jgi:RNA polymerase sigma-70 factor, ECF subfamily